MITKFKLFERSKSTSELVDESDEKYIEEYFDKKMDEYKTYIGKYIIFNHMKNLKFGKVISTGYSQYYFKADVYVYDNEYKRYNVIPSDFHIITFDVIKSFDTFEEAKDYYELVKNVNNYNL
jgi:hypothetical protein